MAVRVLHVLGSMNYGGVETWLINLLRNTDPQRVRMDFLVHTHEPAAYDEEILRLGSQIFSCPYPRRLIRYSWRFREILGQSGPYEALHSHVHHFSGIVLQLARIAGIPERIAHSHNDTRALARRGTPSRKAYLQLSRRLIQLNCTRGLAASRNAACDLFGDAWERDARFRLLPCSIDLAPFHRAIDREAVRRELGFCASDIVFGHVGRFDPQKNHRFLIEIAGEIAKREPRARFLFVGDGPLRLVIEQQAQQAGIAGRVVFTGLCSDVPRLLTGAMDAFLFPSLYEGLGLALIEAQAANLPAIVSDCIPPEAIVVQGLVHPVSLDDPAPVWAAFALSRRQRSADAIEQVERSAYNVRNGIHDLMQVYGVPAGAKNPRRASPVLL
jgi:glycosyltransferase involved in cell wall biosynthesis